MENKNHSNSSRRKFLKMSSLAGIGLATTIGTSCTVSRPTSEKKEVGRLNDSSNNLLSLFNLKYPIF